MDLWTTWPSPLSSYFSGNFSFNISNIYQYKCTIPYVLSCGIYTSASAANCMKTKA